MPQLDCFVLFDAHLASKCHPPQKQHHQLWMLLLLLLPAASVTAIALAAG